MSRVYVYRVHPNGRLVDYAEVPNTTAFNVPLWELVASRNGYRDENAYPCLLADPHVKRMVWTDKVICTLPRQYGLLLAATFDRVWFPARLVPSLGRALAWAWDEVRSGDRALAPTICAVANTLAVLSDGHPRSGVAFDFSMENSWCGMDDDAPGRMTTAVGTDATRLVRDA